MAFNSSIISSTTLRAVATPKTKSDLEDEVLSLEEACAKHTRFIAKYARKFARPGIDLQDLMQEGYIGLVEGHRKFDPARGKYRTFVFNYVKRNIYNTAKRQHLIRIPLQKIRIMEKYFNVQNKLMASGKPYGFSDVVDEMDFIESDRTDIPEAKKQFLTDKQKSHLCKVINAVHTISANTEQDENNPLDIPSTIPSGHHEVVLKELFDPKNKFIDLDKRKRQILLMHLEGASEKQIGEKFQVSGARISQIIHDCKAQLREKLGLQPEIKKYTVNGTSSR